MPEINPSGLQEMGSGEVTLKGEEIYQYMNEIHE